MPQYRVVPVCLGHLTIDMSYNTYMCHAGILIREPLIAFLVLGGPWPVLIDTGAPDLDYCSIHQRPIDRKSTEELHAAVAAHGVDLQEIQVLIMTHLHWDHAGGLRLLPHLRPWVQTSELQFAAAPVASQSRGYDTKAHTRGSTPFWQGPKYREVSGDCEVLPGLRLMLTPGHTAGTQAVLVDTVLGRLALAGDTVPLYANWEQGVPNTIHSDLAACYRSMERLAREADVILPGHDPRVFDRSSYG